MNACTLEKEITSQVYNNILLNEKTARISRTENKELLSINKLYDRGFRKIEV